MTDLGELEPLRAHLLAHSIRTGDFVLKSGRKSKWFIDSKQTICRPDGILLVAEAMLAVLPEEATAIGGMTMGADPVAFITAGVAATRGRALKAFSVRKETKDHGGRIAGALDQGDRVVVTEDTVSRGTTFLEAVHVVREAGAEVVLAVAVVDRGGTAAAMAAAVTGKFIFGSSPKSPSASPATCGGADGACALFGLPAS